MSKHKKSGWTRLNLYRLAEPFWSLPNFLQSLPGGNNPPEEKKRKKTGTITYISMACCFDIETYSFYENGEKHAIMYVWQLSIGGAVLMGRTWAEFVQAMDSIADFYGLSDTKRIIIYVHNLSYEYQFLRLYFNWIDVFADDVRQPLYAVTDRGFEFRCSLRLSGVALARLASELTIYTDVCKHTGDLDYSKPRHSKTPLTPAEIGYCFYDVYTVCAYIVEQANAAGGLLKLPLTKTGFVRQFCAKICREKGNGVYMQHVHGLHLSLPEYQQCKRAFQGGFTHAGNMWAGQTIRGDIVSMDFTSSYPAQMIAQLYPMGNPQYIQIANNDELEKNLKLYCCIFEVEFFNIEEIFIFEHYISASRCYELENPIIDNGRIVSAERLKTTITEQDYYIIKQTYKWSYMRIAGFRRYQRGLLPRPLIQAVLHFYKGKTTLKDVEGREADYLLLKGMLNSTFGMAVMDIVRPEIVYTQNTWDVLIPDAEKQLQDYNDSKTRFLWYPWGVYITAYARAALWTGIINAAGDYLYSDTDSIKLLHYNKHKKYFDRYNAAITARIKKTLDFYGLDAADAAPVTADGTKKPLGVWDFDGQYKTFKTLGAKRYMVDDTHKGLKLTLAGVSKKRGADFFREKKDPFAAFSENLAIPAAYTGKLTHTYIDTDICGYITDYTGQTAPYSEKSFIHLEPTTYAFSDGITPYIDFIAHRQEAKNNGFL